MNEMKQLYIALFLLMSALVTSCGNREAERIMDSAEDVMWTRPDSALTALESIDTLALKTKSQRARYSLLYTMALDRITSQSRICVSSNRQRATMKTTVPMMIR